VFLFGGDAASFITEDIDFDSYISLLTRAAGDVAARF
jgi:hypothetical protein